MENHDNENQKLLFEHKLQIRRILIEKLMLAIIIVLAAFSGNFILESYKSNLAQGQFLLETRLKAIEEIKSSYDKLVDLNGNYFHRGITTTKNKEDYYYSIKSFAKLIDKKGVVFDKNHKKRFRNHVWLHTSVLEMHDLPRQNQEETTQKYALFFQEAFGEFDDLSRELVWQKVKSKSDLFEIEAAIDIDPSEFLNKNYSIWISKQKN